MNATFLDCMVYLVVHCQNIQSNLRDPLPSIAWLGVHCLFKFISQKNVQISLGWYSATLDAPTPQTEINSCCMVHDKERVLLCSTYPTEWFMIMSAIKKRLAFLLRGARNVDEASM